MKLSPKTPEAFHLFVTGGRGTRKSHVISAIKEHLEHSISRGPDIYACILRAPTAVAAFSIGDLTIYRALRLSSVALNALAFHDLRKSSKARSTYYHD